MQAFASTPHSGNTHGTTVFFGYQGERNLTGWPHTILLGKPNSREPEVRQFLTRYGMTRRKQQRKPSI
jgi:hypothetical protein